MASSRNTIEHQSALADAATARSERRRASWAAAQQKALAKVSYFVKGKQFIDVRVEGTTLLVRAGAIGTPGTLSRRRFGTEDTAAREQKRARAKALLAGFKKKRPP